MDKTIKWVIGGAVAIIAIMFIAGGVNGIPSREETVSASWGQLNTQYQRRADLIPNLVETVKGFAAQEKDVLVGVTEARARATQVQVNLGANGLNNPEFFKQLNESQAGVSSALSRLLVTVEKYPELKSNQNFLALQSQLEGTENRISIARNNYIEEVKNFNTYIRTFPGLFWNVFYGKKPYPTFEATAGSDRPPTVNFRN